MGASSGSQHSHWFPWGSDLPGQGQATDRNELCRLLYTCGTIFHDGFYICIYATSSQYSYMQYKEMLYILFSLQTNLHISLHYQCDVLQWNSTNYFFIRYLSWCILLYVKLIQCSHVPEMYG